ncbi:MAG: hypothetical protein IH984_08605 [Planctomycetes bacterium]|nr:hypothetical protein [Planctomycetota bacterium]
MTESQMRDLQEELEQIRDELVARTLDEQRAWIVLDRAAKMLDEAQGSPFEGKLRLIYSLVSAVWDSLRQQKRLRDVLSGK